MHKLRLASLAELAWSGLVWGYPKAPMVTNGVGFVDLRDGLREGNA